MSSGKVNFLFFIQTPEFDELLSLILQVNKCNALDEKRSFFHRRVLRCRELIFTELSVLATPVVHNNHQIQTVVQKKLYQSAEFGTKLQRLGLEVVATSSVSREAFQECLHYTIIAKMAPSWNLVGNILVQGRDFLTSEEPLRATKMEAIVSECEIHLNLEALCIKMPVMKRINCNLSVENSDVTVNNSYANSLQMIPMQEECFVLPSMKKGLVKSVTNYIPVQNNFENYKDMKKHWKNMYGYRLPDIPEENVLYYNVSFSRCFGTTYTYPIFCVRPYDLIEVPRVNPQPTLCSFLNDFHRRVKQVCGYSCQLTDSRASFPLPTLYSSLDCIEAAKPRYGTTYKVPNRGIPYRKSLPTLNQLPKMSTPPSSSGSKDIAALFRLQQASSSATQPPRYAPKFVARRHSLGQQKAQKNVENNQKTATKPQVARKPHKAKDAVSKVSSAQPMGTNWKICKKGVKGRKKKGKRNVEE